MKIESYLGSIAIFTGVSLFAGPLWAGEEISPRLANEVKYAASGHEVMPEVLNKIDRAREIIDAVWNTSLKGDEDNTASQSRKRGRSKLKKFATPTIVIVGYAC